MGDTLEHRVLTEAQAAVAALGLVIDDLRISRAGKRRLVRVAVDDDLAGLEPGDETSTVPPVALDTVADASRAIDAALDAADPMGQAGYVLEVTSPGISRPLTQPRHFRRNVGRLVTLALADGEQLSGRILAAGETGIRIEPRPGDAKGTRTNVAAGGNDTGPRFVEYPALTGAQVQVEFNRLDGSNEFDSNEPDPDDTDDTDPHGEDQEE